MSFTSLDYLAKGNPKQKHAYRILHDHHIMKKLRLFDPILVGTIPIGIDIESSDLDIICCFSDPEEFTNYIIKHFENEENFSIEELLKEENAIVARFKIEDFDIEIFGQDVPTLQQNAYRHLLIEDKLLKQHGEDFKKQVIALKKQGYKTEPAFAHLLGIKGNPYEELLLL